VNKNYPEEDVSKAARKLNADLYIDDRNVGGLPDWGVIYHIINGMERGETSFDKMLFSGEFKDSRRKKNFFIRLGEMMEKNQY
jgi:hypothetical protein